MRIHNPQEEKKNKDKPSGYDHQLHGGIMEDADQFGNLISAAVDNVGENHQENPQENRKSKSRHTKS